MALFVCRPILSLVLHSPPKPLFPAARRFFTHLTIPDLVTDLARQLEEANVPEPRLSAEYLVSKSLSSGHAASPVLAGDWTSHPASNLTETEVTKLTTLVQCRMSNVPIQYLVGNWDFHNITVLCRPPVFIPRPETEQLVTLVLDHMPDQESLKLMEVGPGTGAVSLAILKEAGSRVSSITCVERSKAALELTRDNAALLGMDDKIVLVPGRVGEDEVLESLEETYDLIFSNPPYILRKDLAQLSPQIALYEDLRALDGGAEGLDVILSILDLATAKLRPEGCVILEVDPCHPYILPEKLEERNIKFHLEKTVKDFAGKDRFVVLRKC